VSTADTNRARQVETPAYRWLARNAHRFGFRPYFYEPWHWEYDPQLAASAGDHAAPDTTAAPGELFARLRELVKQARK
jgi:hypothetical protein